MIKFETLTESNYPIIREDDISGEFREVYESIMEDEAGNLIFIYKKSFAGNKKNIESHVIEYYEGQNVRFLMYSEND